MFEIIPFGRRSYFSDPFRALENMERSFFRGNLQEFRTDVSEDDTSYQISADRSSAPMFRKMIHRIRSPLSFPDLKRKRSTWMWKATA